MAEVKKVQKLQCIKVQPVLEKILDKFDACYMGCTTQLAAIRALHILHRLGIRDGTIKQISGDAMNDRDGVHDVSKSVDFMALLNAVGSITKTKDSPPTQITLSKDIKLIVTTLTEPAEKVNDEIVSKCSEMGRLLLSTLIDIDEHDDWSAFESSDSETDETEETDGSSEQTETTQDKSMDAVESQEGNAEGGVEGPAGPKETK